MLLDEAGKKTTKNSVPFVQRAMEQTIAVFVLIWLFPSLALFLTLPEERSKNFHFITSSMK